MEISRWVFAKAFVITVLVLVTIYSFNVFLNSKREISVANDMDETVELLEEMQALTQMMNTFGENATCVTLKSQLKLLDKQTWTLGNKIEDYHRLTQEYMKDPNYVKQKRKFNIQEVLYLSLLRQIRDKCDINQTTILYFYRRGEDCKLCDNQAFVLNHLNGKMDEELAIFSFDADLDLPPVNVLSETYGVDEYPCIVVEDGAYCGLQDREAVESILCEKSPWLSNCGKH